MPRRVNVPAFSAFLARYRNLVERFFNKLKHSRAVATRFEKHVANYPALVKLAAARIGDAVYELVTQSDLIRSGPVAIPVAKDRAAGRHLPALGRLGPPPLTIAENKRKAPLTERFQWLPKIGRFTAVNIGIERIAQKLHAVCQPLR